MFLNWIAEISEEPAVSGFVPVALINVNPLTLGKLASALLEDSISIPKFPVPCLVSEPIAVVLSCTNHLASQRIIKISVRNEVLASSSSEKFYAIICTF